MSTHNYYIRPICQEDNPAVANLIVTVMGEFACIGPEYSSSDAEVHNMYEAYKVEGSRFHVITDDNNIMGCGGIAALLGGPADVCELRKMYFYKELRGLGMGRKLLELCLQDARDLGYQYCYLETVRRMTKANQMYQKYGFKSLDAPMGSSGHGGCDAQYLLTL